MRLSISVGKPRFETPRIALFDTIQVISLNFDSGLYTLIIIEIKQSIENNMYLRCLQVIIRDVCTPVRGISNACLPVIKYIKRCLKSMKRKGLPMSLFHLLLQSNLVRRPW